MALYYVNSSAGFDKFIFQVEVLDRPVIFFCDFSKLLFRFVEAVGGL
jgi:hypothetical protein